MNFIVKLWIRAGERDAFRHYEEIAFEVMKDHGIELMNIQRPAESSLNEPDEIHQLRCDSAEILERYRADPRLKALSGIREQAIARTEIVIETDEEQT